MFTNIEARPRVHLRGVEPGRPSARHQESIQVHAPLQKSSAERATENVKKWQSFLPADCVSEMIKMGWDRTT